MTNVPPLISNKLFPTVLHLIFNFPLLFRSEFKVTLLAPVDSFIVKLASSISRSLSIIMVPPVNKTSAPFLIFNFLSAKTDKNPPLSIIRDVACRLLLLLFKKTFLPMTLSCARGPVILSLPPLRMLNFLGVNELGEEIMGWIFMPL